MKIGSTGLRWWHAGLFVAAFAVSLAAAFPARWAGAAVEHATQGQVRVLAASGSPWQGSGEIVMRANGRDVALGPASWRWLPSRVLAGELAFEVVLANGAARGPMIFAWGPGGAGLRDGRPG